MDLLDQTNRFIRSNSSIISFDQIDFSNQIDLSKTYLSKVNILDIIKCICLSAYLIDPLFDKKYKILIPIYVTCNCSAFYCWPIFFYMVELNC